ncbi:DUF2167 domain-containing protein [Mangrovimonas xylaniphaga]|uniref:DUF2167 domain-containing protein n=1 Tax=Mangrovimonas xylaniphaga TaxID=1645915 RepID=UPI0006B4203C|nr:DUF2167 domain-containing protein [Mangrovimonas xylaniphaga]
MKKIVLNLCFLMLLQLGYSQTETDTISFDLDVVKFYTDSINNSFEFQKGTITLQDGIATLEVPQGFKYLDPEQSNYVLTELWENPPSETLGLLFPENMFPLSDNFTYCVEIGYSEEGYIEDEDAEDLDYDDLLEEMQEDIKAGNPERVAQGYGEMELVRWASAPYYDNVTKKLHWAKELHFEGTDINTLNYNIRVLGRKGYLNLNAIGDIDMLDTFNRDRDQIIESVRFSEGNRYSDFNPDLDEVAAYGIGGLIAGKVLAKAGFFALLLKFWKVIAVGAVALFSGFRKRLFGGKNEEPEA